ncbi:MFS transporter [Cellulosimicrobium cellulans]|uniref:MFS transporter n=1 Tax=Cellulosimicrobium cellulans TaxID=1710 RepID=UPI0021CB16E5|nr:MFS transporter [Cellulosimicrobium cellulans]
MPSARRHAPSPTRTNRPATATSRLRRTLHGPRLALHRRPAPVTDTPADAAAASQAAPAPAAPKPRNATLAALGVRNFRLYVFSQVLTNTSGWAARVAQDWLVLSLTGSAALVGLTVTLQFVPMLLLGLVGGVVADRFPRRRVLMVTQSIFGLSTLTIGVLAISGHVQAWHVLVAAFVSGLATVFDNPARQAFVHEVAGPEHLRQAISVNSAVFQLGGLVGPAVAGGLISAVGEGWTFLLNAVACLAAVALLAVMRAAELTATPVVARAKGQLREGLAYVRRSPRILWSVVLVGFVAVTGVNMATVLAAYTDQVFRTDAGGYALLTSMLAVGALTGALLSTRRRGSRITHLVLLAGAIGLLQLLAAAAPSRPVFITVLIAMGVVTLLYLTGSNTLVQTTVAPHVRGRVMALYVLVLLGAQAVSGTLIGWVCEHLGARAGMVACGVGPLLGAVVVGLALARRSDGGTRATFHRFTHRSPADAAAEPVAA